MQKFLPPAPSTLIQTTDETPPERPSKAWYAHLEQVLKRNNLSYAGLSHPDLFFKTYRCWSADQPSTDFDVLILILYAGDSCIWSNGELMPSKDFSNYFVTPPTLTEAGWVASKHCRLFPHKVLRHYPYNSALLSIPDDASHAWLEKLNKVAGDILLPTAKERHLADWVAAALKTETWASMGEAANHYRPLLERVLEYVKAVHTRVTLLLNRHIIKNVKSVSPGVVEKGDRVILQFGTAAAYVTEVLRPGSGVPVAQLDRKIAHKGLELCALWSLSDLVQATEEDAPLAPPDS